MGNSSTEFMCLDSPDAECIGICKTSQKCRNKRRHMSPFCHIHKRQRIVNGPSIKLLYKNKDLEKIRIEKELMEKLAKKRLEFQRNNTCCICYENGEKERIKRLYCQNRHNNTFIHYSCESKWRLRSNKCPICRTRYPDFSRVRPTGQP